MRAGRDGAGGSARVFVRPVVMLALGVAAGVAMWRVLMADDARGHELARPSVSHAAALIEPPPPATR